jgi:hypothetical protein
MNWKECEAALKPILREALEDHLGGEDLEAVSTQLESEIASFINQHFGLEADRHHCQEITHIEDHGPEGAEKIECGQPANDTWNGTYLCPKHLKLAKDRWKAQGSHFMSEHLRPEADA